MKYVIDTNVLVHIVRNSKTWQWIELTFSPFDEENQTFVSFVSLAEILAFAERNSWGDTKKETLNLILSKLNVLEINTLLLDNYVNIDLYSQGLHPQKKLPKGVSARNMGKNDLWIATSTHKAQADLITTDKDFLHLDEVFFKVHFVENQG